MLQGLRSVLECGHTTGIVANLVMMLGVEKKQLAREPKLSTQNTGYLLFVVFVFLIQSFPLSYESWNSCIVVFHLFVFFFFRMKEPTSKFQFLSDKTKQMN